MFERWRFLLRVWGEADTSGLYTDDTHTHTHSQNVVCTNRTQDSNPLRRPGAGPVAAFQLPQTRL